MLGISIITGWLSGLIGFCAFIPYFVAIYRGRTTPNRATWLIWATVSSISLLSYRASGAGDAIWYPLSDAIAPIIVLVMSIKKGEGGWSILDRMCLTIAGIGVILWWLSGIALIGLCMSLIADSMGAIPTILKAYKRPQSEDRIAWLMTFIAITINLFAVENWHSFSIIVYPIYMFISMGTITGLLWIKPILGGIFEKYRKVV